MSVGFKEALEREIADLEKSLEADPRFIKLRELQRVASLYTPTAQVMDAFKGIVGSIAMVGPVRSGAATRHYGGGEAVAVSDGQRRISAAVRQKVLEDAENILRGRSEPTRTADLYDSLIVLGHEIGGDDPKNNLSAMLSKSPLFRSHKRAGWTLTETETSATESGPDENEEDAAPLEHSGEHDA